MRPAAMPDLPAILGMGEALHAESSRYSMVPYDDEKVEQVARRVVAEGGALVAEMQGTIIGMIAGYVSEHWFSRMKIASDYLFYVRPEHRGGRAAGLLLDAFEEWAAAQGAQDLVPGTSTMIDAAGTARIYEKRGYECTGYGFYKRLNHGN